MISKLDHVNIRTANLNCMIDFYTRVLGLALGLRPEFSFPGAWLYCGEDAVVHLVGVDRAMSPDEIQIEHFAFQGSDIDEFISRLVREDVAYRLANVPGLPLVQVNFSDCDGNHIHVDFEQQY